MVLNRPQGTKTPDLINRPLQTWNCMCASQRAYRFCPFLLCVGRQGQGVCVLTHTHAGHMVASIFFHIYLLICGLSLNLKLTDGATTGWPVNPGNRPPSSQCHSVRCTPPCLLAITGSGVQAQRALHRWSHPSAHPLLSKWWVTWLHGS